MVEVLFFAGLKEQAGTASVSMEAAGMTVKDLKAACKEAYPQINLDQVMTAINEEYARDDTCLQPGDRVAFIPPVSGG